MAWQIQKDKDQFTSSKGKIRYSLKQNAPINSSFHENVLVNKFSNSENDSSFFWKV
jgi:hypothetical protein